MQERDGSNNVTRSYVWDGVSPGGIGGLLSVRQSGTYYDYLYDGKGNVSAVVDDSGSVVAAYRYDEFGVQVAESGTLDQPYRFSTKRYYGGFGISYYGYRFYEPAIGRWLTRDPIGIEGGLNLYGFVGNSGVSRFDALGLVDLIFSGTNDSHPDNPDYFFHIAEHMVKSGGKIIPVKSADEFNGALNTPNITSITYVGHARSDALLLSGGNLKTEFVEDLNNKNTDPCITITLIGCHTADTSVSLFNIAKAFADRFNAIVVGYSVGVSFGTPFVGNKERDPFASYIRGESSIFPAEKIVVKPTPRLSAP